MARPDSFGEGRGSRTLAWLLSLLTNLAQLHIGSVDIDWAAVNQSSGQRVKLPSDPWHYETHWLDRRAGSLSRLEPIRHGFLQQRLSAARPTWQFDADLRVFSYLRDHQIWDGVVFPAAGFAEIGLEVATLRAEADRVRASR